MKVNIDDSSNRQSVNYSDLSLLSEQNELSTFNLSNEIEPKK